MSHGEPPAARLGTISEWLRATPFRIGQIIGARSAEGEYVLCHRDDEARRAELTTLTSPNDAADIARYDDADIYRPLKTAPNLRHGWRLVLAREQEVRLALELFYPGRLAVYCAWRDGKLMTTPLRETLARQTGMYRVAARIADEQADVCVAELCRSDGGCLRTIRWRRDSAGAAPSARLPISKYDPEVDQSGRGEVALPLLCQEACNLLVAKAREVVKASQ